MSSTNFTALIIAAIFAVIIVAIPWESISGQEFPDRLRYLFYFTEEINVLDYKLFGGIVDYFKHEALWHYLIPILKDELNIPLETIFAVISVVCVSVFAYFVVRRKGWASLLLLTSPLLVGFAMSQLRNGLAYSLLMLAYLSRKHVIVALLIVSALFIHSSTLIILFVYVSLTLVNKIIDRRQISRFSIFTVCVGLGILISIIIGPLRYELLGYIDDRRADMGDSSSSILYTSFWMGLLMLAAFQRASFYKDIINQYSIVMLSLVTCNIITGGYTLRFLSISLPMQIYTMLDLDPDKKKICVIFYIIYLIYQWIYWLRIGIF